MENYTFRLKLGHDLFDSIEAFTGENDVKTACRIGGA